MSNTYVMLYNQSELCSKMELLTYLIDRTFCHSQSFKSGQKKHPSFASGGCFASLISCDLQSVHSIQ